MEAFSHADYTTQDANRKGTEMAGRQNDPQHSFGSISLPDRLGHIEEWQESHDKEDATRHSELIKLAEEIMDEVNTIKLDQSNKNGRNAAVVFMIGIAFAVIGAVEGILMILSHISKSNG